MNMIEKIENEQLEKLTRDNQPPDFAPGDTLRVNVKVIEGERERVQVYEGICIGRKNKGINSSFTVRKISSGEGVERVFPLYSPSIAGIDVVRRGDVRRAKLYYLRGLRGKRARIAEKTTGVAGKRAAVEPAAAQARNAQAKKKAAEAKAVAKAAKAQAKPKSKSKSAAKA